MIGLRVGIEIVASPHAVAAAMATLPWMSPERISLDEDRSLLLVTTSFDEPDAACAYATRRLRKSASATGLSISILSAESFPPVIDLRAPTNSFPDRESGSHN